MTNGIMLQFFHWYTKDDGTFWKQLAQEAPALAQAGITGVWLPPAFKGSNGTYSVGYDMYDLYDLGEFDQKGTVRTRYGTREEYIAAAAACHKNNLQVYADIILNHLAGADEAEKVTLIKVREDNRLETLSEPFETEAYTKFYYPGRNGKYSSFVWDKNCFTGVDYDKLNNEMGIYSIVNEYGDGWKDMIDDEKGNYDYLMFADIEFRNTAVREELKRWGNWYYDIIKFDGMRLDAVKHIPPDFYNEWLDHMRSTTKPDLFAVGEYWAPGQLDLLLRYIEATNERMSLFDSSLHHKFFQASKQGKDFDMSKIMEDTLTAVKPQLSVTVVENHDTQPLQALEATVEPWFKPLAYAIILLRQEGYPCVFYTDLYGANYRDKGKDGGEYDIYMPACNKIFELMDARKRFAYGTQRDYFDHGNCIGWTREDEEGHNGCAVLLSNGDKGSKKMEAGKQFAGSTFYDLLGNSEGTVNIDDEGWGEFYCSAGSVSVWVKKQE